MQGDIADILHGMMHTWGWPEWQVREYLPRILLVFVAVGICAKVGDAYLPTELVEDDGSWDRAWEILEKEGIAGPGGTAC